jgi:hypothetical protein
MLAAEIALEQGQPQEALGLLQELQGSGHARRRCASSCARCRRTAMGEIPLLEQLVRRKVFDARRPIRARSVLANN